MSPTELHHAVATATGESVERVQRMGFSEVRVPRMFPWWRHRRRRRAARRLRPTTLPAFPAAGL